MTREEFDEKNMLHGLQEAHDIVSELQDGLCKEHDSIRPGFFGGPTARHNEIMVENRVLRNIARLITERHTRFLKP